MSTRSRILPRNPLFNEIKCLLLVKTSNCLSLVFAIKHHPTMSPRMCFNLCLTVANEYRL